MKKLPFVVVFAAMTLLVVGCQLTGKAKKAIVSYTFCNYSAERFVSRTAFCNSTAVNFFANVTTVAHKDDTVNSGYVGFAGTTINFSGPILNPNTTLENKFKGNLSCSGTLRLNGDASYDGTTFSGTGDVLYWTGGTAAMSGTGKFLNSPGAIYVGWKGVASATITPAAAFLYHVNNGAASEAIPAAATIKIPVIKMNFTP